MQRLPTLIATLIALLTLTVAAPAFAEDVVDPSSFEALLKKYVDDDGQVAYEKWKENEEDRETLDAYLRKIGETEPKGHSKKARLAYWLNAYNAVVLDSVLEKYPIEGPQAVDGFFKGEKHKVAGREMTLDTLEHKIVRKRFEEPRIHFVLVCAAKSCPRLRQTALTEANVEQELEAAAREFIPKATTRDGETITTSKLFEWFAADFKEAAGSVREYLAKYTDGEVKAGLGEESVELKFREYDWSLNKQ